MTRSFATRIKRHNYTNLGSLKLEKSSVVSGIYLPSHELAGHARKLAVRLQDLGVVGAPVKILRDDGEMNDPIAVRSSGSILSFRRQDAKHIKVVVEIL